MRVPIAIFAVSSILVFAAPAAAQDALDCQRVRQGMRMSPEKVEACRQQERAEQEARQAREAERRRELKEQIGTRTDCQYLGGGRTQCTTR